MMPFYSGVYPILDKQVLSSMNLEPDSVLSLWRRMGITCYQYRAKGVDRESYLSQVRKQKELFPDMQIIANDYVDVFCNNNDLFKGIHIGQGDLDDLNSEILSRFLGILKTRKETIAGISTHNLGEIKRVTREYTGKDGIRWEIPWSYIAMGPVASTTSKKEDLSPITSNEQRDEMFRWIINHWSSEGDPAMPVNVVLIGGINPQNLQSVLNSDFIRNKEVLIHVALIRAALQEEELSEIINIMSDYNA